MEEVVNLLKNAFVQLDQIRPYESGTENENSVRKIKAMNLIQNALGKLEGNKTW